MQIDTLARLVVDCGFHIHQNLGPGLLESVYEVVLADAIEQKGLCVRRQIAIPIVYQGRQFEEGFRADLLVEEKLLVELKSVERIVPIHGKQLLTYLRLMDLPLGILMNFGGATYKEGVRRIINGDLTRLD